MNGFLLIDKPVGPTSRKVTDQVGRFFGTKKVGHVGTLDPFASGLLIVAVNKGTKAIQFLDDSFKSYAATIKLGEKTNTGDTEGEVIESKKVPLLTQGKIEEVLNSFLGKGEQIPPMTSAIRVEGKRLYELAHKGLEVERKPRHIEIKDIKLVEYKNDLLTFEATVSKGTYIRVLGEDIAEKLGTVGHLVSLCRTSVGPYYLNDAVQLDSISHSSVKSTYEILSVDSEVVEMDEKEIKRIMDGKVPEITRESDKERLLIVDSDKTAIAIYIKNKDNSFRFARGLF